MCTVTIVPLNDGFRLVCNRDEQRTRLAAAPPQVLMVSGRSATFPIDPLSGGTWVGMNDAGLAAAVLNRAAPTRSWAWTRGFLRRPHFTGANGAARHPPRRSRGDIVPRVLGCETLDTAIAVATSFNPADFALFRLVVAEAARVAVIGSDRVELTVDVMNLSRPVMVTASSLGDALVDRPRRRLFERLVLRHEGRWLAGQMLFHRHQWRSKTAISVQMSRADARTVSRTVVDVASHVVALRYDALPSDERPAVRAA